MNIFLALKKLKKPPQKVAYLSRNSVVSEIFITAQTAKMADIIFQNMANRATVYRTGVTTEGQQDKKLYQRTDIQVDVSIGGVGQPNIGVPLV